MELIPILFILLIFSFIFSGSETAFFSKDEIELNRIYKEKKILKRLFKKIYDSKTSFLITLLFLNTFVNVLFISIADKFYDKLNNIVFLEDFIRIIITTLLLLMIGEITPKMIAVYKSEIFFKLLIIPELFFYILKPLSDIIAFIPERVGSRKKTMEEKELKEFLLLIRNMGYEIDEEAKLVQQYLDLKNTKLEDLMIKKEHIVFVKKDDLVLDVMKIFEKYRFSRMPVVEKSIDNIIGMVYFKDLLYLEKNNSIKGITRKDYRISDKTRVFNILNILLKQRIHLAIIESDKGEIKGAITLNNILEKLIGPLPDEIGETG